MSDDTYTCNECEERWEHCNCQESQVKADVEELKEVLEESVKLQSHYAKLLNAYDGGRRIEFKNANEWIERLKEVKYDNN